MSTLSLLLSHLLAAYATFVEPVSGVRTYRNLERRAGRDPRARLRFYRMGLVVEWAWMVAVALIVVSGGPPLEELGLMLGAPPAEVVGFVVAVVLGGLAPLAVFWLRGRRSGGPGVRESFERMLEPVGVMLPHTGTERWLFAALSVTAGICEEILFRGFLLFYLQEVFPGVGLVGAVIFSSAIFGLAHLYQGIRGVLTTGLFGAGMAILYLYSGNLLLPIIVHALLDLRILLLYRPEAGGGTGE